jgi:mannose-6-phosphate isomerase
LKGLHPGTTRQSFARAVAAGTVESIICSVPVVAGDCFYLPSGTLHALGAGILAAEVQTPSDTTFRVFDFNRIDPSTGKPRTLHVEQALDCIDFSGGSEPLASAGPLVKSEYFTIKKKHAPAGLSAPLETSGPAVWIMLQGHAELKTPDQPIPTDVRLGQTVLLPAAMQPPMRKHLTDCVWLEVTFPSSAARG